MLKPMTALLLISLISSSLNATPKLIEQQLTQLPTPVSNNAVALARTPKGDYLCSFLGLEAGKTKQDITQSGYCYHIQEKRLEKMPDVPGAKGRLAGIAVAVDTLIYIFGGYTVAEDDSEQSIATVHAFDPVKKYYQEKAPMPLPVDDSVALLYQNRYIYLVSGWHDSDNVSLVQVYDTEQNTWFRATDYPGPALFGHAGGIQGEQLVITDGVKVLKDASGKKTGFSASDQAYLGTINRENLTEITWQAIEPHPGKPLYRMAATGTQQGGAQVLFIGGSDNPYNYNGIGYDGVPSEPSNKVFAYDLVAKMWRQWGEKPTATMDHRGLIEYQGQFITVGGMLKGQKTTGRVLGVLLD